MSIDVVARDEPPASGSQPPAKRGHRVLAPPVTGQDAELAGLQRIVAGDQALTIFKAYEPQATDAAKNAIALANKQKPTATADKEGVPATLLDPVVVTKENIKDTIVADKFYELADICTAEYAAACGALGLS